MKSPRGSGRSGYKRDLDENVVTIDTDSAPLILF